jgi:hypothetical protein
MEKYPTESQDLRRVVVVLIIIIIIIIIRCMKE